MQKYIIASCFVISSCFAMDKQDDSSREEKGGQLVSPEIYRTVFTNPLLFPSLDGDKNYDDARAYRELGDFFNGHGIKEYTGAATLGRSCTRYVEQINEQLGKQFKTNTRDTVPVEGREYQAIIFNTSGIDGFTERLAFLARLFKAKRCSSRRLVALVGDHQHRDDLRTPEYLEKLPTLFPAEFESKHTYSKEESLACVADLLKKNAWTHRDGMDAAWRLVSGDPFMKQLASKFEFFERKGLRTKELISAFMKDDFVKPLSANNSIAFITSTQGESQLREIVAQAFPKDQDSVDLLVSAPVSHEIEGALFNDTPEQRAAVKLFHLYRTLEARLQKPATK